jgi:hypothetical protein
MPTILDAYRTARQQLIALALGAGLILSAGPNYVQADSTVQDSPATRSQPAALADPPHTDGYGLLPKLPPLDREESARLFVESKRACEGLCTTPFGTVLGIADDAEGHSNCTSTCVRLEYSFLDLESGAVSVRREDPKQSNLRYIGVTYQCVEYVRKWWMKNKGITFGGVDSAYEIIYLTEGSRIRSQESIPLARSINGTARRPPKRGDLVIYYADRSDPEWRHGHAAVMVAVDLEKGIVALAEENYDNRPWQDPKAFARQIRLFEVNGRYTLLDVAPNASRNPEGGRIAGWIYPLADE